MQLRAYALVQLKTIIITCFKLYILFFLKKMLKLYMVLAHIIFKPQISKICNGFSFFIYVCVCVCARVRDLEFSVNLDCAENFFQHICVSVSGSHVLFIEPTNTFFSKIFIKTGSHNTIHIFKNYFVTVFSVFSNKRYLNKPLIGF